ncbi:MAG: hypothetical protein NZ583_05325 [Desulfobacterota bacterium]|nr:hypothetical protein [Thermodesulfobacteriota bacterium]MDW8002347.1 hypothetical protein [Deltaproteobacteria bacterium]
MEEGSTEKDKYRIQTEDANSNEKKTSGTEKFAEPFDFLTKTI